MSGPMDPEALQDIRSRSMFGGESFWAGDVRPLLADRDYWRSRCVVTGEDVQGAGVTYAHLDRFCEAYGFSPARASDELRFKRGRSDIGWEREGGFIGDHHAWPGNRRYDGGPKDIAGFIAMAAVELERPAMEVLDEMAGLEVIS